jgi:hypothetical protein
MSGGNDYIMGNVVCAPAHFTAEDAMAASIVRLECDNDELTARVAVLEAEQQIIVRERDEAREMAEELLEKNAKQAVEIVRLKEAE